MEEEKLKAEIERLRANVIAQGTVLESLMCLLPTESLARLANDVSERCEKLNARSLPSTMPDAFVEGLSTATSAWQAVIHRTLKASLQQ